jgi:hypothetical protein
MRCPNDPQSLTLFRGTNWEMIAWNFEFFPRAVFFPTVQEKTSLTSFPNRSDRFRPVGCREGFLSKGVSVALWLLLFRWGMALEVFRVSGVFWGVSGQNQSDRFDQFPLSV